MRSAIDHKDYRRMIDYVELLQMNGVLPEGDDERGNPDQGGGCIRWGRRLYAWDAVGFAYCKRYGTVEEAVATSLAMWPLTFDETVATLEALPVVAEQLAGFGIELSSTSPHEQLTNVLSLGFVVCEALRTVAHDWGHYRLATALNRLGYRPAVAAADDESWLTSWDEDDGFLSRPLTDAEAQTYMAELEADGGDAYRWGQVWEIGRHFYRADSEAEAIALVEAIGACLDAAKLEGVEL